MSSEDLLVAENVRKEFGGLVAVSDLDFTIDAGWAAASLSSAVWRSVGSMVTISTEDALGDCDGTNIMVETRR